MPLLYSILKRIPFYRRYHMSLKHTLLTVVSLIFIVSCASAPKNCKEGDCTNGIGTTIHDNGTYKGSFKSSTREGLGEYTFNNGDIYRGNYKNNMRNGEGEYTWKNGDNYRGFWLDGKRHGFGIYTWSDGTRYEGEWQNDARHGKGKLILKDGTVFDGMWDNNTFIRNENQK